jgi:hypothetical protein
MSNHLSSHTAKRSRTSYCTPKKKVGERERERERERESTEQAKIEINNKINEIYKIGVFRIGNSNFSVERKRIELAIYYEKIIKYIIYNNIEEHPIDYLDSIGC